MLIVGASGFAKEILQIFHDTNNLSDLAFYDDINANQSVFERFQVLKNELEVKAYFEAHGPEFTLGLGNPQLRNKLYIKFKELGGKFSSAISPFARIGNYNVTLGIGTNVLSGATFSNSTKIGIGGIVYYNVVVTHDCIIGDFVELSPNVQLLGRCEIGSFTQVGSNVVVLPDVKIGTNVIIGAGAVVTKNVPDNCLVVGVPAKVIKYLEPLNLAKLF
ncbi:acetyltransferase [Pedobacter africanus]|uniref:Sugar O-acyltransferase, sialic acid O-acetyltransferase NeuD family n=1 Tax=Pedobacter africanus TaxID=151894 RepID=A0A1W2BTF7_9SPHI|nr:acetyltransferase [Pedobacter africanus]SMC75858.1 sugar O-acyltransferase, sialic acid O-acetyltransferase NeuD family [Pedobacter africanus]